MRWLFRVFFLERFSWPWSRARVGRSVSRLPAREEILYKTELDYLVWLLMNQLKERVYYNVDATGRAILGTVEETIAHITLHPKGNEKKRIYIMVRLEDGYEMHKAWFQLAFVCFKVRFRRSTLTLQKSWKAPSRGH